MKMRARRRRTMLRLPHLLLVLLLSLLIRGGSSRLGGDDDAPTDDNNKHLPEGPQSAPWPSSLQEQHVEVSTKFPPFSDTFEMARLSLLIYSFYGKSSCNATRSDGSVILPLDLTCHHYEHDSQGTQLMIVSSKTKEYVAVVFAGTDDARTSLADGNIATKQFGPKCDSDSFPDDEEYPLLATEEEGRRWFGPKKICPEGNESYPLSPNKDIRVHAGFDNTVFKNNVFTRILSTLRTVRNSHPSYRIVTTGHSLGGADSTLTAVALKHYYPPKEYILAINFGSPRTGNREWREYVNSIENLGIWRFVNGIDVVPRLPDVRFVHVGHTVQLEKKEREGAKAYYLHDGDKELGFVGVPFGWGTKSFIPFLIPSAVWAHHIKNYITYFKDRSADDQDTYYVHDFEKVGSISSSSFIPPRGEDDSGSDAEDYDDYVDPSLDVDYYHGEEDVMDLTDDVSEAVIRNLMDMFMKGGEDDEEGEVKVPISMI